nr:MAG TPA: hypothetical protein [Caudoviricetes sp.]
MPNVEIFVVRLKISRFTKTFVVVVVGEVCWLN